MSGGPVQILAFGELPVTPWRNGGGFTREVASVTPPGGADFDWRVSVADVAEPGAFSAFPGVERVIVLLEGEQMVLTVDGAERVLLPHEPFAFAGESVTTCELPGGRTRDLNLMTRRDRCSGSMEVLELVPGQRLPLLGVTVLVALDGAVQVDDRAGVGAAVLHRLDAVLSRDAGEPVQEGRVQGPGRVAVIRVVLG